MRTYKLFLSGKSNQNAKIESFVGGIPKLPKNTVLPACSLCGAMETFFFQIAFPSEHAWKGFTLALFACTSCAHEDFLIPEMLPTKLKGAIIPSGFLQDYQKNFHTYLFQTSFGEPVISYREKVVFREIKFELECLEVQTFGLTGDAPIWVIEDESPSIYEGKNMIFLFQIHFEKQFEINPGVPKQIKLNLRGLPVSSTHDYYQLFIGNEIFFYGTEVPENSIYIWTQV